MKQRIPLLLLFAFCAFALFWRLGGHGLTEPDEGRTAGIGYEFFASDTWLVPRLYDLAHFNKPPLVYWACAVAYRIGGVNEWMARLPAALAAFGTLMLTHAITRRLFGKREATAAALILLTAPMFFVMAHIIDPNMMLTFWITLSMWAAVAWFQDGKKIQQWIFWLALGIAFLAKGPPAIGVVGLALAGFRFAPRDRNADAQHVAWRSLANLPAILACVCIALGWFVAAALKYPELWNFFLGRELVGRIAGDVHQRSQSFFFFVPILLGGILPWLPALIISFVDAFKRFKADARARLLLSWIVLPLIMFSFSKSKLPPYILPLLPPLAILAGAKIVASLERRWMTFVQLPLACLFAAALPTIAGIAGSHEYGWNKAEMLLLLFRQSPWLAPVAVVAMAFLLVFRNLLRPAGATVFVAASYLAGLGLFSTIENDLGAHSSPRKMCEAIAPQLRPGDRVVLFKNFPRGVNFYLQRQVSISDKFELQITNDVERLAGRFYTEDDVAPVYRWFDHEPRVFVVTSDRPRGGAAGKEKSPLDFLRAGCRKAVREVYRDGRSVVVCNFAPDSSS